MTNADTHLLWYGEYGIGRRIGRVTLPTNSFRCVTGSSRRRSFVLRQFSGEPLAFRRSARIRLEPLMRPCHLCERERYIGNGWLIGNSEGDK